MTESSASASTQPRELFSLGSANGDVDLTIANIQFGPFTCLIGSLDTSCSLASVTVVAPATSNLSAGTGTFQSTITIDFSPSGTCNIVDEPGVFTFDNGTIFTHSHHADYKIHGLRIDTTFQVTGGTGAFAGATGRAASSVPDRTATTPRSFTSGRSLSRPRAIRTTSSVRPANEVLAAAHPKPTRTAQRMDRGTAGNSVRAHTLRR